MTEAECQNCRWAGLVAETKPIKDYSQRVAPGEEMPCGECPECGALAHEAEQRRWLEPGAPIPKETEA
jgi:hypothetical protein